MTLMSFVRSLPLQRVRVDWLALPRGLAELERRLTLMDTTSRMQLAMLLSLVFHAVVLFGVTIRPPQKSPLHNWNQALEVVLVNARSPVRPERPDALAQVNLDGGGNTDASRRAKSPLPVTRNDRRVSEVALEARRLQQLEREAQKLMTRLQSEKQVASAPPQPEPQTETRLAPTSADILRKSVEIARLEAQISTNWDSYQKRPRRRFIGARVQEFRFASYVEDWRLKIQRVGELNYPQAARDQKIYGNLVVTVSLRADGTVEKVEINRPSGQKILDEAAIRIVRLAAPFAPFPPDIARDTDILSITRTWTFTRSDQLVTE